MLHVETLIGKVEPKIIASQKGKVHLPLPASVGNIWELSHCPVHAECLLEEKAIFVSFATRNFQFHQTLVKVIEKHKHLAMDHSLLEAIGCTDDTYSSTYFDVFRCWMEEPLFCAEITRKDAKSEIRLSCYRQLTEQYVFELMKKYPNCNISVQVVNPIHGILFKKGSTN